VSQEKHGNFPYITLNDRFFTGNGSVYCAVRPGSLNKMDYVSSLNG